MFDGMLLLEELVLTRIRLNRLPVKKGLPSTASSAAIPTQATWTRYVQISRTVPFLVTPLVGDALLEKRTNQTTAASPRIFKASAATAEQALPMQQTHAALGQM